MGTLVGLHTLMLIRQRMQVRPLSWLSVGRAAVAGGGGREEEEEEGEWEGVVGDALPALLSHVTSLTKRETANPVHANPTSGGGGNPQAAAAVLDGCEASPWLSLSPLLIAVFVADSLNKQAELLHSPARAAGRQG